MADSVNSGPGTLWESLSKKEQQALVKQMNRLREQEPVKGQPAKKNGFNLKGYIRCDLSASDKEAFKVWEVGHPAEECFGLLVKAADSGYLLKVGEAGQGGLASLSAATTGQPWDGFVLTAHAGSAVRAAVLLVYKHSVLMEGDWQAWMTEEGED